jgi:hypothetical protein
LLFELVAQDVDDVLLVAQDLDGPGGFEIQLPDLYVGLGAGVERIVLEVFQGAKRIDAGGIRDLDRGKIRHVRTGSEWLTVQPPRVAGCGCRVAPGDRRETWISIDRGVPLGCFAQDVLCRIAPEQVRERLPQLLTAEILCLPEGQFIVIQRIRRYWATLAPEEKRARAQKNARWSRRENPESTA